MRVDELTKDERWYIADRLAAERLPEVNATCTPVHPSTTLYARYSKRVIDILISVICLIITLPINLIIFIITFFDVGRPIFFEQTRTGRNGKPFTIIKFRNMRNTRDEHGDLLPPAQRVTKFGKFVRKTSLDELLNFWSILKGDMSIIGPRPLLPEYEPRYSERHRGRLCVRPGLECPPRHRSDHMWTWNEQFENDIWYVENLSFRTDLLMAKNLVVFALDGKSAGARATGQRGAFTGYDAFGKAIAITDISEQELDELLVGYQAM